MKTTSSKKAGAKRSDPAGPSKGAGYEDRPTFARASASPTPEYDTRKAKSAQGHDDQGGSRQSESRDYERARTKAGEDGEEATHSDQRHEHERYGEQSVSQRQDSKARESQQNLGGQDSRDQSPGDRFSLQGRAGGTAGEASDTLSEQGRRKEERQSAPGGAGYDTNWTREDKGNQPGPAAGSDKDKERSSGS